MLCVTARKPLIKKPCILIKRLNGVFDQNAGLIIQRLFRGSLRMHKKITLRVYNGRWHFVELMAGFEPATSSLPRMRSTDWATSASATTCIIAEKAGQCKSFRQKNWNFVRKCRRADLREGKRMNFGCWGTGMGHDKAIRRSADRVQNQAVLRAGTVNHRRSLFLQ